MIGLSYMIDSPVSMANLTSVSPRGARETVIPDPSIFGARSVITRWAYALNSGSLSRSSLLGASPVSGLLRAWSSGSRSVESLASAFGASRTRMLIGALRQRSTILRASRSWSAGLKGPPRESSQRSLSVHESNHQETCWPHSMQRPLRLGLRCEQSIPSRSSMSSTSFRATGPGLPMPIVSSRVRVSVLHRIPTTSGWSTTCRLRCPLLQVPTLRAEATHDHYRAQLDCQIGDLAGAVVSAAVAGAVLDLADAGLDVGHRVTRRAEKQSRQPGRVDDHVGGHHVRAESQRAGLQAGCEALPPGVGHFTPGQPLDLGTWPALVLDQPDQEVALLLGGTNLVVSRVAHRDLP